MAKVFELSPDYPAWLASRPPSVKALAERCPPDRLYRLKSTGQRGTIHAYSEHNTVTVTFDGTWGVVAFARNVFGISPDDLEECDLPSDDELRGIIFSDEETEEFINSARALNGLPPITLQAARALNAGEDDETLH